MARREMRMPDLGLAEVRASQWHVRSGAAVAEGERVLEVVADGVVVDLGSPAEGVLVRRAVEPEEVLRPGMLLAVIEAAGE